ncbi:hypothetical protein KAW50_03445 [candidate division WOR-3 bacterium]|nr:hypothetical protein [candidate division WOR-3 bacterium]
MLRQFAKARAQDLGLDYSEDRFGKKFFTLKVITMSQYDAPDLRGMPQISGDEVKITRFFPTEELPREGQGIIFFDEMNLADETVRAAMYSYILEGRISNLPPVLDKDNKEKFWRVAASNSEQDYCGVHTTSLALLSRFCHLQLEPELNEIINYLLEHDDDPRIVGYLKNFPEDLWPQGKWDERLLDRKANPFPRQWENASHLIKGLKDNLLIQDLVGSCVSPEVASRFIAYVKLTGKLDMVKFLAHPKEAIEKIKQSSEKASLFYAIISTLASFWFKKDKKLVPEKVAEVAHELPPEFSVAFLKMILKKRTKELVALKNFEQLFKKLGVYIDEV